MFLPGRLALMVFVLLLPVAGLAMEPDSSCLAAAAAAERRWALPPNLIAAIGRVESGGFDQSGVRTSPWPWTVNAAGTGAYFPTLMDAVRFVRTQQSRGVRLIDVGCFQVDLFYHPSAFASLEQAFDPGINADYAARFLAALYAETGSWPAAVARYHSGLASLGDSYRLKVMSTWSLSGAPVNGMKVSARAPGLTHGEASDRVVILMSASARTIRIFRPSSSKKTD